MLNPQITLDQKNWAASKITNQLAAQGSTKNVNTQYLTSSKLRRDTTLASSPSYTGISFNAQGVTPNATEIMLGLNDAFLVTAMRLSIKKIASATPTDTLHKQTRDFTYPNTFVFDGTNEVLNIFAIWNSTLTITQNSSVRFPKIATCDFLFAPDNQYADITGLITGPTYSRKLNDSKNSPNYGFNAVEPFLLLGTDQSNFTLNVGAALNITEASETNFFTITLDGWLLSGQ